MLIWIPRRCKSILPLNVVHPPFSAYAKINEVSRAKSSWGSRISDRPLSAPQIGPIPPRETTKQLRETTNLFLLALCRQRFVPLPAPPIRHKSLNKQCRNNADKLHVYATANEPSADEARSRIFSASNQKIADKEGTERREL